MSSKTLVVFDFDWWAADKVYKMEFAYMSAGPLSVSSEDSGPQATRSRRG